MAQANLHDAMDDSPFEGRAVTGWPVTTIARGEVVWHEGHVAGEPGRGRFVARIPDDHVFVSANAPRIRKLNLADKDHYLAPDNVFSLAEQAKVEEEAVWLYTQDPAKAKEYLAEYSHEIANGAVDACWKLAEELWTKYTNYFRP